MKKSVSFIFADNERGQKIALGTGFFVAVTNPKEKNKGWSYLVTANHVLKRPDGKRLSSAWLRLNKSKGGFDFVRLDLNDPKRKTVFNHPGDADVDIAVVPVTIPEDFDVVMLPVEMLTAREDFPKLGISEGTEVFFSGLFTGFIGQSRNYPIFRFGKVAMLSDEKIPWNENGQTKMLNLYLLETQSYGGNSGSPVFFYFGAEREPGSIVIGPVEVRLAGIMMGSFNRGEPIRMMSNSPIPVSLQNMGIAAVVPSYLLQEILMSEEMTKLRSTH